MAKVSTLKMDKRIAFVELQKDEDNPFPSPDDQQIQVVVYECWARVFTTKQDIITVMGSTGTKTFLRFVIRKSKSFTPTTSHKLRFNGKLYNITSALNDDYENNTVTITVEGFGS